MQRIWKCKEQKQGFEPRFSVIFLPIIWIFMESEEPQIKSKQASKRDGTLKEEGGSFSFKTGTVKSKYKILGANFISGCRVSKWGLQN